MKLKTLRLFYLNQFYKIIFLICLGFISIKADSSEEHPGLIESLERLLDTHHKQIDSLKNRVQANFKKIKNLSELKEFSINPLFLESLLFHSDDKFITLASKEECRFYSIIENKLLKTTFGELNSILIDYVDMNGIHDTGVMNYTDFFDQLYKIKCFNNREYKFLFSRSNVVKTVEGVKFQVPKNKNECEIIHKEWIQNPFTPYLCAIKQELKNHTDKDLSEYYKNKISTFQRTYLVNLCSNLNSHEKFCENYLKLDAWNMVLNSEAPEYKLSYKCRNYLGNDESVLTPKDLKTCAAKFISEPKICETKGNQNFPSLFPLQSCDNISLALTKSKLVTNYHDCPGSIDNEGITNIHRIISHFSPNKKSGLHNNCKGEANYAFAKLNFEIKHDEGWPLKVCFLDRIRNEESCLPYIPGTMTDEPLSEDQVVAKILYMHKGAQKKTTCRIVSSKSYNPIRTEYKYGCFIVYDLETCTTLTCKKRVVWDEHEQKDIKFIGKPVFDYFPTAFLNERYSFYSMINVTKGTSQRQLKNITSLKQFLDKTENGIAHGIGCAEDIIPEEFGRRTINQCRPVPFIVDGHVAKDNETWLVTRLSIDDLHSPRIIQWQNIFNSVTSYRELHPLNTWTFYGIKK